MNSNVSDFAKNFHGPIPQDWSYKGIESAIWPSLRNLVRLTPYSIDYVRYSAGLSHDADHSTVSGWLKAKEAKP